MSIPNQTESKKKKPKSELENLANENFLKRERRKKQATQKIVETLRKALPDYSLEEIREFRLPYHEALTLNLEEEGYVSTAAYINELIHFQDEMRRDAPPGSNIAMRPQLKLSKDEIVFLSEKLKISEVYHDANKIEEECEEFLKLGIHFAFVHPDWWWLGEQILIQSIKISSSYECLGGKYEALSRYAYARFLYEKVKEYENAGTQLQISSQLSIGKGWTSVNYFPEVRGTLFMQTNHALFDCMIRDVKLMMKVDPVKAIEMSNDARRRAALACHYNGESKALVLKGLCEMEIMETKTAVNSLLRAYNIQSKFGNVEGVCKVRIHLAKAYLLDDCGNASLKVLMDLKQDAEEFNLPFYLGQAYRHLGDYYLSNAAPDMANPLLKEALRIFKECNVDSEEVANVRNLEAISAGLQLFPKYVEILNNSGTENSAMFKNLMKIVDWKDQRKEFWELGELQKMQELPFVIKKSMMKVQGSRADVLNEKFLTLSTSVLNRRKTEEHETSKVKSDEEIQRKRKIKLPEVAEDKIVELFAPKEITALESQLAIGDREYEDDDENK